MTLAWKILREDGALGRTVDLLQMHMGATYALQLQSRQSNVWFRVNIGFTQGDVNAPTLLNIVMDTLCGLLEPLVRHLGLNVSYSIDGHSAGFWILNCTHNV
jgi:hypothetical protein